MDSTGLSRRRFIHLASTSAALGLVSHGRPAMANPYLLAIVPAIVTGVFSLLNTFTDIRLRQRQTDAELLRAREDVERYRARMLRREFEDRQKQDRDALVVAWIKAGVDAGMINYKVAFDVAKSRLLTLDVSSAIGLNNAGLGIEDGFVRVQSGARTEYMHGGELQVAGTYLQRTGRMPIPLDAPQTLGNSAQLAARKALAAAYGMPQREFDGRYAIYSSRPYTLGKGNTDYWTHAVVNEPLYNEGRPQQMGFIET